MASRIKVLIIHNIMAPYRFPLFKAIAQHPDIDLSVWFMTRSAKNRKWSETNEDLGFNYKILPSIEINHFSRDLFTYIINYTFMWEYARHKFDVVISAGWLDFASHVSFLASKVLRRKFVIWSESTYFEPSVRRSIAAPLVRAIVTGADSCIAVGTRSRQYLCILGAFDKDIFTAFSTVDIGHFQRVSAVARPGRDAHRRALGIKRRHVLLYCGQFIERKGLHFLLEAFSIIKQRHDDVALVLVGYGAMRSDLLAEVVRRDLSDVLFIDHVEVAEMPRMYALADVFVLPSLEETWGLVVNEAMACGLPVIVTDNVGSSVDLVRDGDNGFVIAARDSAAIAERSLRLLGDGALLARFARNAAVRIEAFTPERAATEFARAVCHALTR